MAAGRGHADEPKRTLDWPRRLLSFSLLWPEQAGRFRTALAAAKVLMFVVLQYGQTRYVVHHIAAEPVKSAMAMTTWAANIQIIFKIAVVHNNAGRLAPLLNTVRERFWRSDLLGKETEATLNGFSRSLTIYMGMLCSTAFIAISTIALTTIISGSRELPWKVEFPVDHSKSPIFEILATWEVALWVWILIPTIMGYDFLFLSLCNNIICQFEMLHLALKQIGENDVLSEEFGNHFAITNISYGSKGERRLDYTKLVKKCVKHHILLLSVIEQLETIFNIPNLIQLVCTVTAICFSTFLFSIIETVDTQFFLFMGCCLFGNIIQFFSMCVAGNEISFRASLIADSIFASKWYEYHDLSLRKDLLVIMANASKIPKITAFRIFPVNYGTFMQVLKLSFSFRTFLSQVSVGTNK